MAKIGKAPWCITIKEKPFHRYSIAYFRKCLRKIEAEVTKQVSSNMDIIQFIVCELELEKNGYKTEDLMKYRSFKDQTIKEQEFVKTIRIAVENVFKQYPFCTIGIYGLIYSDSDVINQVDDILQQLSSITENSADYKEVFEREQLWNEAMKLCEEYSTLASIKSKKAKKQWEEFIVKVEFDNERYGEKHWDKWKEFKEIAEVFSADQKKERRYWFIVKNHFSFGYWHELKEENTIATLKNIIKKYPIRMRQAQIEGVETVEDIKERLRGWFCTPDETTFSAFVTHEIIKVGIAGAIAKSEKVNKSTKIDMIFEFSNPKELSEYTIGLLNQMVPAELERGVNVFIKHELDIMDDDINKLLNEAVWIDVVSDNNA